jgi:hypothetical protein
VSTCGRALLNLSHGDRHRDVSAKSDGLSLSEMTDAKT